MIFFQFAKYSYNVLDAQRSYFDAQIGLSNAIRDKQITM